MKNLVHKTCEIEKGVVIKPGTKIWNFTHVRRGATIGKNCNIGQGVFIDVEVAIGDCVKIQNNVSVYRGVTIEDGVFCGPSCVFTNVLNPRSCYPRDIKDFTTTKVCQGASIGANATIICGNKIGRYAFVGAGAVVTKDVKDYAIVVGNPAKQSGWLCECGEKLLFNKPAVAKTNCFKCGKTYRLAGALVQRVMD